MGECNVDDIICQIKVLDRLRDLKSVLGNETFISDFPELEGLDEKLLNKIQTSETNIKEALAKCGRVEEEAEQI